MDFVISNDHTLFTWEVKDETLIIEQASCNKSVFIAIDDIYGYSLVMDEKRVCGHMDDQYKMTLIIHYTLKTENIIIVVTNKKYKYKLKELILFLKEVTKF